MKRALAIALLLSLASCDTCEIPQLTDDGQSLPLPIKIKVTLTF